MSAHKKIIIRIRPNRISTKTVGVVTAVEATLAASVLVKRASDAMAKDGHKEKASDLAFLAKQLIEVTEPGGAAT